MRRLVASLAVLTSLAYSLPPSDAVVAVVGDQAVYVSELRDAMEMSLANPQVQTLSAEQRASQVLQQLVDEKVLLWRAKAETLQVSESEVNTRVDQQIATASRQSGGDAAFASMLRERLNLSLSQYRTRMGRQVREQLLKQRLQEVHVGRSEPTREDVMKFYAEYKDSLPVLPDQMRVSQIILKIKASPTREAKAKAEAEALIERLRKGESFEDLAKLNSDDPSAAANGGDIGFFKRGELDPAYERAALALETGRHTTIPIRSRFGWHVIELVATRDQEFRSRHILRALLPTKSDSDATAALADSLRRMANAGADFAALARQYSEEKASASFGGTLGWFSEKDLQDPYKGILAKIPTGSVGEPIPAGDSYILLRIDQRTPSRQMTPEEDWIRLSQFASEVLAQRKLRSFVERWRKEVNVEIRIQGPELARRLAN